MTLTTHFKRAAVAAACVIATSHASAALVLTAAGIADGFTLSTFVSGYSFGTYGPLSQAVLPTGKIITGSMGDAKIYVMNDVDNQTLADAVTAVPYTFTTGNPHYAMANASGQVYGAQLFGGVFEKFASDGSKVAMGGAVAGLRGYLGMWTNPVNGHLIASTYSGLVDIDPIAETFRVINGGLFPDGVSVSKDGATAYVENGGTIQAYAIATGALLHTYFTGHAPDGTGVIYGGKFDGDIIVNNNDGTVGLLDPTSGDLSIIADGGSRGDFVSADSNNGTLFLSQVDRVMRLSCGSDCSIGAPPTPTPEPGSLALAGLALLGLQLARRRR